MISLKLIGEAFILMRRTPISRKKSKNPKSIGLKFLRIVNTLTVSRSLERITARSSGPIQNYVRSSALNVRSSGLFRNSVSPNKTLFVQAISMFARANAYTTLTEDSSLEWTPCSLERTLQNSKPKF
jgi:hypothetical protein